jgi:large subunit ribosomal protein L24
MDIKKADQVLVIKGRDRGKSGVVVAVSPSTGQVKIEGLNVVKRHLKKSSRAGQPGGITEKILPIPVSKVMLICANCHKPVRVGHKTVSGKTERVCKKCQAIISYVKK